MCEARRRHRNRARQRSRDQLHTEGTNMHVCVCVRERHRCAQVQINATSQHFLFKFKFLSELKFSARSFLCVSCLLLLFVIFDSFCQLSVKLKTLCVHDLIYDFWLRKQRLGQVNMNEMCL